MKLETIFKVPINYFVNIFEFLINNSRSNLLIVMDETKKHNYEENGQLNLEYNIIMLHKFYNEELEDYCVKNSFNVIRELELRKNELEQNLNYFTNIIIGVLTGILATLVTNIYSSWFGLINKSMDSIGYTIRNMLLSISILLCAFLFFPLVRFIIHSFRKDIKGEFQLLDQCELKVINEILNRKMEEMLDTMKVRIKNDN